MKHANLSQAQNYSKDEERVWNEFLSLPNSIKDSCLTTENYHVNLEKNVAM